MVEINVSVLLMSFEEHVGLDCPDVGVLKTEAGLSPLEPAVGNSELDSGVSCPGVILVELFLISAREHPLLPLCLLLWCTCDKPSAKYFESLVPLHNFRFSKTQRIVFVS